jgi:phosphopentomutase/2,3-bisphosphoglycerate-independent phosphoglycerate mutase family metalloenzyme
MKRCAFFACLVLLGCGPAHVDPPPLACEPRPDDGWRVDRVVLVTIDGVRWQELAYGVDPRLGPSLPRRDARALVPTLYALAQRGVGIVGEMRTSAPRPVSLPGYREILTGRRGGSCVDNFCPPIDEPTLLDELVESGVPGDAVAEISSWEGLERAAAARPDVALLSTGRHGGATRVRLATDAGARALLDTAAERHDYDAHPDYRRDADTTALALRYLLAAKPRLMHVALGDTDVHAHAGNYAGYLEALVAADAFVAEVLAATEALGGETVVIVTTDHGRATGFRDHGRPGDGSERVWMIAAGGPIPGRGFVRPATMRRLADIAPTVRTLVGLAADGSERGGAPLPELLGDRLEPLPQSASSRTLDREVHGRRRRQHQRHEDGQECKAAE